MQCPACLTLPESEGRNVRSVAPALQVALAGAAPADLAQPPAQTVMRDYARLPARLRDAEEERLEVVGSESGRPDPLADVDDSRGRVGRPDEHVGWPEGEKLTNVVSVLVLGAALLLAVDWIGLAEPDKRIPHPSRPLF